MIMGCGDSTVIIATPDAEMLLAFHTIIYYIRSHSAHADGALNWDAFELNDGCFYLVKIVV
jgi:hypothetical protein